MELHHELLEISLKVMINIRDQLGHKVLMAVMGQRETREIMVPLDTLAFLVCQDRKEMMVLLEKLVFQGPLDLQEHQVTLGPVAYRESLEVL